MKTICILLFAFCTAFASAQVVNSGFETGDFTGWTSTGDADVYTGANYLDSGILPYAGNYFAALHAGSSIWQTGLSLTAGQTVSAYLSALLTSNNSSYLLIQKSGSAAIAVEWHPTYVDDPVFPDKYSLISYTITESGIYSIGAENLGPYIPPQLGGGVLGIDNFTITGAGPGAVPEPNTYGIVAAGLLVGLVALRRRAHRARVTA
jgi:hypothetical protein